MTGFHCPCAPQVIEAADSEVEIVRSPVAKTFLVLCAALMAGGILVVSTVPMRLLLDGRLWAGPEEQAARRTLPGFIHAPNSSAFMGRFAVGNTAVDIWQVDRAVLDDIAVQVQPDGDVVRESTDRGIFYRRLTHITATGETYHFAWVETIEGDDGFALSWQTPVSADDEQMELLWIDIRALVQAFVSSRR